MPWALVSGEKGSGRWKLTAELALALRAEGLRVAGFVQRPVAGGGYELLRLSTDEVAPLARPEGTARPGEDAFCSFVFSRSAFEAARRWLEEDEPSAQVFFCDEVSKLEAAGRGHHDALRLLLERARERPVVLGVRADQLFDVMTKLGLDAPLGELAASAQGDERHRFLEQLRAAVRSPGDARRERLR